MRSSKCLTRYASLRVLLARPLYFRFKTDEHVVTFILLVILRNLEIQVIHFFEVRV